MTDCRLSFSLSSLLNNAYAPVSVNPWGNPGDSDSFLTSHQGGYDHGVQPQGQAVLTFKIKIFPPPGVGNKGDSNTRGTNEAGDFDRRYF